MLLLLLVASCENWLMQALIFAEKREKKREREKERRERKREIEKRREEKKRKEEKREEKESKREKRKEEKRREKRDRYTHISTHTHTQTHTSAHTDTHQDMSEELLNPPVVVRPHICKIDREREFEVHVFRDDALPGGTKQRAMADTVRQVAKESRLHPVEEIVYAGPVEGFAQIAMAVTAKVLNIAASVFVAKQRDGTLFHLTQRAKDQGASIHEVPPPNRLKDVQQAAKVYTEEEQAKGRRVLLMPFGLHCPAFLDALEHQLRDSIPRHVMLQPPRRMWLVAGSAAILEVMARIFPTTEFMVVQVGKTIWPDQRG